MGPGGVVKLRTHNYIRWMFIPKIQGCVLGMKIYDRKETAKNYYNCLIYLQTKIKEYPEKCYQCQTIISMN